MDWSKIQHFTEDEFRCKCNCGRADMDIAFVMKLDFLRADYGKPIRINSGFRCPDHNDAVSSTGRDGPHTTGKAADIAVMGADAHQILSLAPLIKFTGIGVSQKGPHGSRFIHLDTLEGATRPWVWSYG